MLQLQHLSKSFGDTPVFRDVGFEVARGEFVALIGESGVGKSTLLNCIAGLERPTAARVRLAGQDVLALDEDARARLRRAQLGFVFQAFHVLPHLSVAENVALPLLLLGRPDAARVQRGARRGRPGRARPRACRRSCRAGSCSAWRSRARWCMRRR